MFPEAAYAWSRLKLTLAEVLVLGVVNRGPDKALKDGLEAANSINEFKNTHYPNPNKKKPDAMTAPGK